MSKRKSRAEWQEEKAAKKVTARLLSELLLTRDDKLERFRLTRATARTRPELERLREVQAILVALGDAIQRGEGDDWDRVQLAWELLAGEGRKLPLPTRESGEEPAEVTPPAGPADATSTSDRGQQDAAEQSARVRKPTLADPAPPGALPRPSGLPAPKPPPRPARLSAPPIPPLPPAPSTPPPSPAARSSSQEHTELRSAPNPQPVMPFRSSSHPSRPPGRVAPPDPSVPAPPVSSSLGRRWLGLKPPWPGRDNDGDGPLVGEDTGLTAVLNEDGVAQAATPALPFVGGAPATPLPFGEPPDDLEFDDVTDQIESPLRGALLAAQACEEEDPLETTTRMADPGVRHPIAAAVAAFDTYDWDELGRTPTWDELPWAAELREASATAEPSSPGCAGGYDTAPLSAIDVEAVAAAAPSSAAGHPSQPGLADEYGGSSREGVDTIVGQPPAFLARLQAVTLDQYASMRAECELFPERLDEVRRLVGVEDDTEQEALDELWRRRFSQSPTLRSQFEQAVARYRVWLQQKGKE